MDPGDQSNLCDFDSDQNESIALFDKAETPSTAVISSKDKSININFYQDEISNNKSDSLLLEPQVVLNDNNQSLSNAAAALEFLLASNATPDSKEHSKFNSNNNIAENHHYNDYINQAYSDKSEIFQEVDKKNITTLWVDSQRKNNKNTIVELSNNKIGKLKSIVKSPSSPNFVKKQRVPLNVGKRLSLRGTERSSLIDDRPVLRVQFEGLEKKSLKDPVQIHHETETNVTDDSTSSSSSSSSSSSEFEENRPPDGGWGWVVVFASFMVNLIADGITFSFGVIFVEFLDYFNEGKAKTAWIGSLFMAIPLLSGPIASFLTDRYGCRKVTIVGSNLACIGFVLSAFSDSMEALFLFFGILAGFGLSLCYVAAVVIVAYYFEKKRSLATGLSVCGSGIGTFIFAPLTQFFLEEYGWRGTTLLLAGFFLNMNIFGLLMRDLKWTTHSARLKAKNIKNKKVRLSAESFSFSTSTNTASTSHQQGTSNNDDTKGEDDYDDTRLFSSLVTLPTFVRNGEKVPPEVLELLASHKNVHTIFQNYPNIINSRSFSEPYSAQNVIVLNNSNNVNQTNCLENNNENSSIDNVEQQIKINYKKTNYNNNCNNRNYLTSDNRAQSPPSAAYLKDLRLHRRSLTYRGAMLNISNRYRLRASSCPDIYRNSMTTIAKEKNYWYQGVDDFKNLFLDILDFSHFLDVRFFLFSMSNFILYTWYDVPYVYLTDYAQKIGIDETDASILVGVIGLVNMFAEIFLGWVGDQRNISPNVVYALCMVLCGMVVCAVPLYTSFLWLCTISALFGAFIAANYALTSIILVEIITIEKFTNAYGLLLLVQGVANLVGPPIAGWIYDVSGTYDLSFYIAGIFISISGIMLLIPSLGRFCKKKDNRNSESPDNRVNCNGGNIINDRYNNETFINKNTKIDNV